MIFRLIALKIYIKLSKYLLKTSLIDFAYYQRFGN